MLVFAPRAKVMRSKGETLWTLNWLPIGGFVRMEGEDGDAADDPRFPGHTVTLAQRDRLRPARRSVRGDRRPPPGADRRRGPAEYLVLRQGTGLIIAGTVLGLIAGLPLARLLGDRLYRIEFTDTASWLAALAIVVLVALIASWLPARRAAATDPMVALRSE